MLVFRGEGNKGCRLNGLNNKGLFSESWKSEVHGQSAGRVASSCGPLQEDLLREDLLREDLLQAALLAISIAVNLPVFPYFLPDCIIIAKFQFLKNKTTSHIGLGMC